MLTNLSPSHTNGGGGGRQNQTPSAYHRIPRCVLTQKSSKFKNQSSLSLLSADSFVDLPVPEEVKLPGWGGQRGGGQVDGLEFPPEGRRRRRGGGRGGGSGL